MDKKIIKKLTLLYVKVIICLSVILVMVHLFPDERIKGNIKVSVIKMVEEGNYPQQGYPSKYHNLNYYTEASILNFLYLSENEHPVKSSFLNDYYTDKSAEDQSGLGKLVSLINEKDDLSNKVSSRSSYWIGYRIFIRPLLYFTHYYNARYICTFISCIIIVISIIVLSRKTNSVIALMYSFALFSINVMVVVNSFNLGQFLLQILSIALVYLVEKRPDKGDYLSFMFVIGMLTAFFDWLSIPLVTYGVITIFILFLQYMEDKSSHLTKYMVIIVKTILGWGMGYGGMIIGRVVFSSIIGGKAQMLYFLNRIFADVGVESGKNALSLEKVGAVLNKNINGLFPMNLDLFPGAIYRLLPVITGIFVIVSISFCLIRYKDKRGINIALLTVACSPFVWFIVFCSHCTIHCWMMYRILIISVLSILMIYYISFEEQWEKIRKVNKDKII